MPEKTTLLENLIMVVLIVFALSVSLGPILWNYFRKAQVLKAGVGAEAKVIDVTDTGRRHNDNPVVKIRLLVTDRDGKDYLAEVVMPVSPVSLNRYRPGAAVAVKYDPHSPEKVAIADAEPGGETQ